MNSCLQLVVTHEQRSLPPMGRADPPEPLGLEFFNLPGVRSLTKRRVCVPLACLCEPCGVRVNKGCQPRIRIRLLVVWLS